MERGEKGESLRVVQRSEQCKFAQPERYVTVNSQINSKQLQGKISEKAYATLLLEDSFVHGVLALVRSLAKTGTSYPLLLLHTSNVALATLNTVKTHTHHIKCRNKSTSHQLTNEAEFDTSEEYAAMPAAHDQGTKGGVRMVQRLSKVACSPSPSDDLPGTCAIKLICRSIEDISQPASKATGAAEKRSESWSRMITKLRLWQQVDFITLVYIDADCLVLENIDELFERLENSSRPAFAPDVFPPDRFNAGVIVLHPDAHVFACMMQAAGVTDHAISCTNVFPGGTSSIAECTGEENPEQIFNSKNSDRQQKLTEDQPYRNVSERTEGHSLERERVSAEEREQCCYLCVPSVLSSYDGSDTGFLNAFYPDWFIWPSENRLRFCYNAQRSVYRLTGAASTAAHAYNNDNDHRTNSSSHSSCLNHGIKRGNRGYWDAIGEIKILHFSSSPKPWELPPWAAQTELEELWWNMYTADRFHSLLN